MSEFTREGIKHTDGAVHVHGLATGEDVPTDAKPFPGTNAFPPAKFVSADGAIYVRYS